ncbi:hypothetical protein K4F52_003291 [Lecanicillium sp. MT-2017a]|nr:hypothetical protein K4F52_003291 [Lecanicillium sp. MT-2017a]
MKSFMADDWLMLIAQIIFTASCAFILEGVNRGMGKHNDAIASDDDKVAALMWQAVATITYILDMMFVKLSIGVFLLRLSVKKVYNYIIWVSLVVVALYTLGVFFWDIFQCTPVAKQWDYRIVGGHCATPQDIINAAYAISVLTVVSDWLYALLPIPMLWNVKMTKQAKATVIVILGLGIFASIATLIRLRFLAGLEDSQDLLYSATDAMVWTLVEPGVAIIASSLATIRPLLRAMRIRGFESTDRTPSTGISSKRNPNSMPGYGPNDVSLNRVTVDGESKRDSTRPMGLAFDDYHRHAAGMPPSPPLQYQQDMSASAATTRRPSEAKSEVYVIEGSKHSPSWSGREYQPSDRSFDDIHGLEEQSQEFGHGLSAGPRR